MGYSDGACRKTHTSHPKEKDIVDSAFNTWCVRKRLAVVGEIYQGGSSKAYNLLKEIVTDAEFHANEKHQKQYDIPCSRDNPKILGGYDTEIVGDRIA